MPMPIQTPEEYEKVLNVSWYSPEKPREEQRYDHGPVFEKRYLRLTDEPASLASCPSPGCILCAASIFAIFSTNFTSLLMTTFPTPM